MVNRPLVDELDVHLLAETPSHTGTPERAQLGTEPLVERLRLPRAARAAAKLGRLPFAVSAISANLRDDEHGHRNVHD